MSDQTQPEQSSKHYYSELGWTVIRRIETLQQGYLNDSPQARADLAELYARHQRGRTTPMHQRGVNLGEAVSRLAWLEGMDNEKAVRRHFDAAVMSTTFSGFFNHLKGLIGQLGSNRAAIAIDYGLLAQDLYRFAIPGGKQKVILSWARGYARQKNEKSETNSQTK